MKTFLDFLLKAEPGLLLFGMAFILIGLSIAATFVVALVHGPAVFLK
ncbi:hypothetical protein [Anatilimnocola floriformis]|nr:hypothetical protein [Anatilimnocola floriformis]